MGCSWGWRCGKKDCQASSFLCELAEPGRARLQLCCLDVPNLVCQAPIPLVGIGLQTLLSWSSAPPHRRLHFELTRRLLLHAVDCKKGLEMLMVRKSKDVRLDFRFRLLCREDVSKLCPGFGNLVFKPW